MKTILQKILKEKWFLILFAFLVVFIGIVLINKSFLNLYSFKNENITKQNIQLLPKSISCLSKNDVSILGVGGENKDNFIKKLFDVCDSSFEMKIDSVHYFIKKGNLFDPNIEHAVVLEVTNSGSAKYFSMLSIYSKKDQIWKQILLGKVETPEQIIKSLENVSGHEFLNPISIVTDEDINGDGINDLKLLIDASPTNSNESYIIFIYNQKKDIFYGPFKLTNPSYDKDMNLTVSPSEEPGYDYYNSYYRTENYKLIEIGNFSNYYDENTQNVLPKIQKLLYGVLQDYNKIQINLLNTIKTETYFEIVGKNFLSYDKNHYKSWSTAAWRSAEDDSSDREYFVKNIGDINMDGCIEYVVAEIIFKPYQYVIFHLASKQKDDTFKLIGGEKIFAGLPFDYDVNIAGMWNSFEIKDIIGDGKSEIINIPSGCSGNGVCSKEIFTFNKIGSILEPISQKIFYDQNKSSSDFDFDTIERVGNDIITFGHDLDFRIKSYYSFSEKTLFFEHGIELKAKDPYTDKGGYTYLEINKNGETNFSEERKGSIWEVKL